MARRPFDPAAHGWTKTEYRQGDILDRDAVDDLVARRRRRRPPRVPDHGLARGEPADQPDRHPQRLRGHGRGRAAAAAGLHVVGRRLRLPRRQPRAADRGRAGPRVGASTTTPSRRPSARRCCTRSPTAPTSRSTCCGRASWPGRRRPRWPTRCRGGSVAEVLPAALRGAVERVQGLLPLMPDPGDAAAARAPRRRRDGDRPGRRRRRRARRLQPRGRRRDLAGRRRRGHRDAVGAHPAAGRRRGVGRAGPAADGAGRRPSGSTSARNSVVMDTTRAKEHPRAGDRSTPAARRSTSSPPPSDCPPRARLRR